MISEYLVVTKDHFVLTCEYLVVTNDDFVLACQYLVVTFLGARESLVVMCDSLVVTRYYLVRKRAFCSCFVLNLLCFGRPTLDL